MLNNLVALGVAESFPWVSPATKEKDSSCSAPCGRCGACGWTHFRNRRSPHLYLLQAPGDRAGPRPASSIAWTARIGPPTPRDVEDHLIAALHPEAPRIDALIIMDQVDLADTGRGNPPRAGGGGGDRRRRPELRILADSRRGLRGYPSVCLKMNRAELGVLLGSDGKGVRNLLCEAPGTDRRLVGPFRQKVPDTFSAPSDLRKPARRRSTSPGVTAATYS